MFSNPSDTLVIDTARLQVWRRDDDYAYGRELVPSQDSLMDWVAKRLNDFSRISLAAISIRTIMTLYGYVSDWRHWELSWRSSCGSILSCSLVQDEGNRWNTRLRKIRYMALISQVK